MEEREMRLPKAQDDMIRRWVLGGPDAVGKHSTRTVIALERAGYLDRNGPTRKARDYVEAQHRALVEEER